MRQHKLELLKFIKGQNSNSKIKNRTQSEGRQETLCQYKWTPWILLESTVKNNEQNVFDIYLSYRTSMRFFKIKICSLEQLQKLFKVYKQIDDFGDFFYPLKLRINGSKELEQTIFFSKKKPLEFIHWLSRYNTSKLTCVYHECINK